MAKPAVPTALVSEVRNTIRTMSPVRTTQLPADGDRLESAWRLFAYQRRALAAPFERIARGWRPDATIHRGKAEQLRTVKAAIVLVAAAAGFTYGDQ